MKLTLQDRLIMEKIARIDRQLNEASDEEVLRQLKAPMRRLERFAKNLKGLESLGAYIDGVKKEAMKYAAGPDSKIPGASRVNRLFSRNVMKKIDKAVKSLQQLQRVVHDIAPIAPNIEPGEMHDETVRRLIKKRLKAIRKQFKNNDAIVNELEETLMHLTPKQMKSFGKRPLNLSSEQDKAIHGDEPDEAPEGDSEGPDAADKPEAPEAPDAAGKPEDAEEAEGTEDEPVDDAVVDEIKRGQDELFQRLRSGEINFREYVYHLQKLLKDAQPEEGPEPKPAGGGEGKPAPGGAADDVGT